MDKIKVIVRTESAGVFFGVMHKKNGDEVVLGDAIRIWYWKGANSLSQLSTDGVRFPGDCKFAVPVKTIILNRWIEIIPCTDKAIESIEGVKPWAD